MKRLKGMVAKIDKENKTMVVVTEDKQFKRVPLPDAIPVLGSTIEVSLPPEKNKSAESLLKTKWLAAAVILLMVFGISMFGNLGPSPVSASAYVTLDMTPSVQLSVDKNGKVLGATALNKAGKKLIKELEIKNKDVYVVVKDAVGKASRQGYFKKNEDNIVMAAVSKITNSSLYQIEKEKLRSVIHDELSKDHYPGYVIVNEADEKTWQKAQKSGYSVNKALVSQQVKKKGIDLDPKTLNTKDMRQVINSSETSVPSLFPDNSCRVSWQEKRNASERQSGMQRSGNNDKHSSENNMQTPQEGSERWKNNWNDNHWQDNKKRWDERKNHEDEREHR